MAQKRTTWDKIAFIAQMTLLISTAIVTIDQIKRVSETNRLLTQQQNEK